MTRTVQIVDYRFDPWAPFMVGMTATVWLQTPITAVSSTGTGDLLAVGGNAIINAYVPIAEPVTLGLLGVSLALMAGFRRRF